LKTRTLEFSPDVSDNRRLANLCGPLDQNLRQIEETFDVRIARRNDSFHVDGSADAARRAVSALKHFWSRSEAPLSLDDIQLDLVELRAPEPARAAEGNDTDAPIILHTRRTDLQGRTPRQREYLRNILAHDITFGIGPAGTGKTYLAVACAVDALERDAIKRIVLTRPAVEAGERLGFLPGDLAQKVDPYLRPLYDALYDLLGFERTARMFEKQAIEIAPLAYMRGRTLNNSFIILDEAQNTTPEQMKMFLTRIGFGSRAVVTGDMTQIDLPRGQASGIIEARRVLQGIRGLAFTEFDSSDVVRHPLVARIVDAYERFAPREE
jgi:phosphate starvation-inducible PhoH-like protein